MKISMQRFLKILDYNCFVCGAPIANPPAEEQVYFAHRGCSKKGHFRIFVDSKGLVIHTYINIGEFLTTLFFDKKLEYLEMYGKSPDNDRIKLNPIQFIEDNKDKGEQTLLAKFRTMRNFS